MTEITQTAVEKQQAVVDSVHFTNLKANSLEQKPYAQYLLAMVYAEQLTSSVQHYITLVTIAADWGIKSVEPFVTNSRLHGTRCLNGSVESQTFYRYAQLINIPQFDRELRQCLTIDRVYLTDNRTVFLSHSYRDIVVVHFVLLKPHPIASNCGNIHTNRPYLNILQQANDSMVECTSIAEREGLSGAVERTLNNELDASGLSDSGPFRVNKVICVSGLKEVSLTRLKDLVQSPEGRKSIVFVMWQSERSMAIASSSEKAKLHRCSVSHLQHSAEVSKAASLFLDSLNLTLSFLSLHIRSERIIHTNSLHPGYQKCCMSRLHILIDNIMKKHKLLSVLLVKDYGQYGTDSCFYGNHHTRPHWYCRKLSDDMMKKIGEWDIHYSAFDPSKFQTVKNSGFVSLDEKDTLLQGDVLVTVGTGSFQGQLRRTFNSLGKMEYHICPCYKGKENLHGLITSDSCDK